MPSSSETKIKEGMEFEDWSKAWLELCEERGHSLEKDSWGGVDIFALNYSYCNGPRCTKCGWAACMHCDFYGKGIPSCNQEEK